MFGNLRATRNLLAVACILLAACLRGQMMPPPPLDPATYTSPSGHYSVWINPSKPDGSGRAFYKLSKDGHVAWSKDLPFTLAEVAVDDAGRVGGFARLQEFARNGFLEVALLGADGAVLLDEKHPETASHVVDGPSNPMGIGVMMDEANDRMVVMIGDPEWGNFAESVGPAWWTYGLTTGKPGEIYHPRSSMEKGMLSLRNWRPVPGTSLVLLEWSVFGEAYNSSTTYTLVNAQTKPVWRLDLNLDNEPAGTGRTSDEEPGSIISAGPDGRFALRMLKTAKRVNYLVKPSGGTWQVAETGREAYVAPHKKSSRPSLVAQSVSLKLVRKWRVRLDKGPLNPIRDVDSFQFISQNRVAVLRSGDQPAVVITSLRGKVERQIALPSTSSTGEEHRFLTSAGGSSLIVAASRDGDKPNSKAWLIDASTGKLTPLLKFAADSVKGIAGFRDGRFAVITETFKSYTMSSHIAVYAPDGHRLWDHEGAGYGQSESEVKDPSDVAVDAHQHLMILNQFANIQVFDEQGKYLRTVDFKKGAAQGAYLTIFTPLKQDAFLVAGLTELGDGLSRVEQGGSVAKAIVPQFQDRKKPARVERVAQDATGRIWMSDGENIYLLNSNGVMVSTLGRPTSNSGLTAIQNLCVDPAGRVYALDRETAQVHYFGPDGKLEHVAKPLPADYTERPPSAYELQLTRSGDVYVGAGPFGSDWLHYSSTGARIAKIPRDVDKTSKEPPSKADPTWRWVGDRLIDQHGKTVGRVDRWPNLDWMTDGPTAVAPDGSLMSIGEKGERGYRQAPDRIAFFSSTGKPESMSTLPVGLGEVISEAYDGRIAYVVSKNEIMAIDKAGKPRWRFKLGPISRGSWEVFVSRGGIAVWDEKVTVYWYKTP